MDDALFDALNSSAADVGTTRSAFIKSTLAKALDPPTGDQRSYSTDDGGRVQIHFRIGEGQARALSADAAQQHLLPSDIVRELVHARYYDGGEKALFYGEAVRKEAFAIRAEINAIGRNVNNAARRLMSAVNDGDPREMVERAEDLEIMREGIAAVVESGQAAIERMAAADYQYWRGVK